MLEDRDEMENLPKERTAVSVKEDMRLHPFKNGFKPSDLSVKTDNIKYSLFCSKSQR